MGAARGSRVGSWANEVLIHFKPLVYTILSINFVHWLFNIICVLQNVKYEICILKNGGYIENLRLGIAWEKPGRVLGQ